MQHSITTAQLLITSSSHQFMMGRSTSRDLRYEKDRLLTFVGWTSPVSPIKLAAAGFYYLTKSDLTRCPFCGVIVYEWEVCDDPLLDHCKWSKNCPFIKYLDQLESLPLKAGDEIDCEEEKQFGCC